MTDPVVFVKEKIEDIWKYSEIVRRLSRQLAHLPPAAIWVTLSALLHPAQLICAAGFETSQPGAPFFAQRRVGDG